MNYIKTILAAATLAGAAFAKVDLSTLPSRDGVQLTIYNSSDLTLVRENRELTVKNGLNNLQFSWANTLIDPTSLQMLPMKNGDKIDIMELTYPPRVSNLGLWKINSDVSGKNPFEISYFTSGISWRAFYIGTLATDEKTMELKGYVVVTNNSGENYENAVTRLIVGKVNLLDEIAALARRDAPYGRPTPTMVRPAAPSGAWQKGKKLMREMGAAPAMADSLYSYALETKEIKKESLSEYFLYTIEGTETIPTGWSKRLPSFTTEDVPVVNLFKYERNRYGAKPVRFLSFKNDEEHELGETPIPGGSLKVFRNADAENHLSYEGASSFKYIPVGEDVELNLGTSEDVIIEQTLMNKQTENFVFDRNGNVNGWEDINTHTFTVKNTRPVEAKVEITVNLHNQYWELQLRGDEGEYKKIDLDTWRYTVKLAPRSEQTFETTTRIFQGRRQEAWRNK